MEARSSARKGRPWIDDQGLHIPAGFHGTPDLSLREWIVLVCLEERVGKDKILALVSCSATTLWRITKDLKNKGYLPR